MTRRSKRKIVAPDVREAWVVYIAAMFRTQMKGMLRSRDVEQRYVALGDDTQEATEQQIAALSRAAAEYFVDHNDPSHGTLTKDEVDRLKRAALDHALNSIK